MDKQFYDYLKNLAKDSKTRIAIFPFQDGSQGDLDPVIEKGYAILLYNLLKNTKDVSVYHPFLIFDQLKKNSMTSPDYFNDDKIMQAGKELGATHIVYGMFQKKGTFLRYFIKVASVEKNQSLGSIQEYSSEQTERFFAVTADAGKNILGSIGKFKRDEEYVKKFLKESPSFESFRYYIKGMEKSGSYNEVDLGIAKVWFEKSSTLSYAFSGAYEEMARCLFMMALIQKQMGKDASLLWTEGQGVLERGTLTSKNTFTQNSSLGAVRWLTSNFNFALGVGKLQSGDSSEAKNNLSEAVKLLPEDGLAHFYLGKAGGGGDQDTLARTLNGCL